MELVPSEHQIKLHSTEKEGGEGEGEGEEIRGERKEAEEKRKRQKDEEKDTEEGEGRVMSRPHSFTAYAITCTISFRACEALVSVICLVL